MITTGRLSSGALLLIALLASLIPGAAEAAALLAPPPIQIRADAFILTEATTGAVLVEHQADVPTPPASLTKIMTDYLIAAELASGRISLDDKVPVSERAWRTGGSKMFIEVGDMVRLEDLIYGIVVQSGNDASVATAEYIAGSEEAFASLMTQQAALLGMTRTMYQNATGWPAENHYTSARDLSLLTRRLISDFPQHYATYYATRHFTYGTDISTGKPIRQANRNTLLHSDTTVDGVKTGFTEEAGFSMVTSAVRNGMRLIAVVLGAGSAQARAQESQSLLSYGYRFYETRPVYLANETLQEARVWQGETEHVAIGVAQDVVLTLPRGAHKELRASMTLAPELTAPLAEGDVVGALVIHAANAEADAPPLQQVDLVTLSAVPEAGFMGQLWDGLYLFLSRLMS